MDGAALTAPQGLVARMAATWRDPRAAARVEIAHADEARLLFYAVASSALYALGLVGAESLAPRPAAAADWSAWVATQAPVALFFRPLALYASAAVIGLVCRAAGGRGGWRATRAATFWTALAIEPAAMAAAALGAAATGLAGAPEAVAAAGRSAGGLFWALLLAPALAEAHGFDTRRVLAALAAVAVAAGLLAAFA